MAAGETMELRELLGMPLRGRKRGGIGVFRGLGVGVGGLRGLGFFGV